MYTGCPILSFTLVFFQQCYIGTLVIEQNLNHHKVHISSVICCSYFFCRNKWVKSRYSLAYRNHNMILTPLFTAVYFRECPRDKRCEGMNNYLLLTIFLLSLTRKIASSERILCYFSYCRRKFRLVHVYGTEINDHVTCSQGNFYLKL